jgi:hypothetical protein
MTSTPARGCTGLGFSLRGLEKPWLATGHTSTGSISARRGLTPTAGLLSGQAGYRDLKDPLGSTSLTTHPHK